MLPNKKGNDAKKFSLLLPNIISKKRKICRISILISARKRSDYIWFTLAGTYIPRASEKCRNFLKSTDALCKVSNAI